MTRSFLLFTLLTAASLLPAGALAHPRVEEARRRVAEADFDAAERAFAAAEASSDLDRADAIALLEGRALLAHALHDRQRMEADLRRLAALDPAHTFAPQLPPELAATFTRIRGGGIEPLDLVADARREGGTVRVTARLRGDPGGLVRELRLHARVAGGAWRTATQSGATGTPAELVLDVPPGTTVEHWSVAIGPGAAPIAERGTANAPIALTTVAASDYTPGVGPQATPVAGSATDAAIADLIRSEIEEDQNDDGTTVEISGWVIVAVVLVAAAIGVGIYFALDPPSEDTRPSMPIIPGFD
jgi:hypothetical protein